MQDLPKHKSKLVCTIGLAFDSPEMLEKLIKAELNAARLNFSHGDFASHGEVYKEKWGKAFPDYVFL